MFAFTISSCIKYFQFTELHIKKSRVAQSVVPCIIVLLYSFFFIDNSTTPQRLIFVRIGTTYYSFESVHYYINIIT